MKGLPENPPAFYDCAREARVIDRITVELQSLGIRNADLTVRAIEVGIGGLCLSEGPGTLRVGIHPFVGRVRQLPAISSRWTRQRLATE